VAVFLVEVWSCDRTEHNACFHPRSTRPTETVVSGGELRGIQTSHSNKKGSHKLKALPQRKGFGDFHRLPSAFSVIYSPLASEEALSESLTDAEALYAFAAFLKVNQADVREILHDFAALLREVLNAFHAALTAVRTCTALVPAYACCKALARALYAEEMAAP